MFRIIRDPPSRFGGSAAAGSQQQQRQQQEVAAAAAGGGGGGGGGLHHQYQHHPSPMSSSSFSMMTTPNRTTTAAAAALSSPSSLLFSSSSPPPPPSSSVNIVGGGITSPMTTRRALFGGSLSSWGASASNANANANTNTNQMTTTAAAALLERAPSRLIGSPEPLPPSPPPPPVPPRSISYGGYGQQANRFQYDSPVANSSSKFAAAVPSSSLVSSSIPTVAAAAAAQPIVPPSSVVRHQSSTSSSSPVEEAAAAHPPGPLILLPCPICFRTFKPESLERHRNVCVKVATGKKRKVFDSSKQRCEDLPDVLPTRSSSSPTANSPTRSVPSSPFFKRASSAASAAPGNTNNNNIRSSLRGDRSNIPTLTANKPSWKDQHLSLIKTVRAARAADVTRCPYCERNFGNKAFDRHVDWCREQQSRIPKSPTNTEAKERWEARTKYRAPALRRSMRSMTRDKYSPTRSISSGYGYNYGSGGGGGSGTSPAQSIDRLSTMSALPSTDYISRHTTPSSGGGGGGGGGESLSGSRASLDSRASSTYSAVSHQPVSLTSGVGVTSSRYNNNFGSGGGNRMANTLGRTSGSAFMRQANERRSLRLTPTSPPPSPLIAKPAPPPTIAVQLTPISNNRASALRASLRMKNPFSNLSASFQPPVASQPQLKMHKPVPTPTLTNSSTSSSSTNKRPTVLQLFTSAFSRPSPASSTKNLRSNNNSQTSTTAVAPPIANLHSSHYQSAPQPTTSFPPYYTNSPYQQQQQQNNSNKGGGGQGRRSEPEGVESKLMTASCFDGTGNYISSAATTPKSPVPPPRTSIKPSRFSIGDSSGGDRYNPYLSAERQMAELFNDSKATAAPPPPLIQQHVTTARPATPTTPMMNNQLQHQPTEKERDQAEAASMEQLEMDLKSILSEISQLGKTNSERDQTARDIYINNSRAGVNNTMMITTKEPSPPPPPTLEREPSPPAAVAPPAPPKFCHSCGSSYPDRFTVKFCCQCGARRLYV